jgi:hypothetical protein
MKKLTIMWTVLVLSVVAFVFFCMKVMHYSTGQTALRCAITSVVGGVLSLVLNGKMPLEEAIMARFFWYRREYIGYFFLYIACVGGLVLIVDDVFTTLLPQYWLLLANLAVPMICAAVWAFVTRNLYSNLLVAAKRYQALEASWSRENKI